MTNLDFGGFSLDRANRELRRDGQRIELGSRYFDALALLAGEAGRLVSKDRFMAEVWRGIPVTDEALTQCIRSLRRALSDEAGAPRFIETVPKHGYRFVAEVAEGSAGPSPSTTVLARPRRSASGRLAGVGTIGGGGAGMIGGLAYGAAATAGGAATLPVLIALGAALGVVGGAGVGSGMALATAFRQGHLALVGGAAVGGLIAGAVGNILSREGVSLLTGASVGPVTGIAEGAMLGLATGAAMALGGPHRPAAAIGIGALCGALAGLLLALAGGRMFGASLFALQDRLPASGLALDRIGAALGEDGFGRVARLVTAALEGAAFVTGIVAAGLLVLRRRPPDP